MNKLVLFIVVSLWGNIAFPQDTAADVEELRIALVYNFSKYISWPESVFSATENVTFCIAGSPGLVAKFSILNGQLTNEKTIRVVAVRQPSSAVQDCHILYVAADYEADTEQLLVLFGDRPVLTVGDGSGFLEHGGVIELLEVNNKVAFRINNAQAQVKHIAISSMLLRLAR